MTLQLLVAGSAFAVAATAGLVVGSTPGKVVALTSVALPISVLRTASIIITERELSYRPVVAAEIAETGVFAVVAVTFALLGFGPVCVGFAAIAREAAGSGILLALVPRGRVRPSARIAPAWPLIPFGLKFQAISLVGLLRDQMLNIAIAAIAGFAALGLWWAAFRFMQLTFLVLEALWRVAYPAMAQFQRSGRNLRAALERTAGITALPLGALLVAMVAGGPETIALTLGTQWRPAYDVVPLAALGLAINGPVSAAASGYLFTAGRAGTVLRAVCGDALVWMAVGLPLLSSAGIRAIGLGWLAGSAFEALVLAFATRQALGADLLRQVRPSTVCGIAASGAGVAAAAAVGGYLGVVVGISLAELIYVSALALVAPGRLADARNLLVRAFADLRRASPPPSLGA